MKIGVLPISTKKCIDSVNEHREGDKLLMGKKLFEVRKEFVDNTDICV